MMTGRGVVVTYEIHPPGCRKFGQTFANQLGRRRPRPGDMWDLDKVFLTINDGTWALSPAS
jgi:putative transposase